MDVPEDNQAAGLKRRVRKRAIKACQLCHDRKVRCNMEENGPPCANCRLDQAECIATQRKRRRTASEIHVGRSLLPTHNQGGEEESDDQDHDDFDSSNLQPAAHNASPRRNRSCDSDRARLSPLFTPHSHSQIPPGNATDDLQSRDRPFANPGRSDKLPRYIRPLPSRLDREDLIFLEKKGAFTIPPESLRNALLRSYIEYVHGYTPLLDLYEFLNAVQGEDSEPSSPSISLILFQAVMFAGSAFVPLDTLQGAGFQTRRSARDVLFQRARLLYDFDCEQDQISLAQALLLMVYRYDSPESRKNTWYWLGVAIELVQSLEKARFSHQNKKLWRRIWWTCYSRDRLMAANLKRPTRMGGPDTIPMLTLADFDFHDLPVKLVNMLGNSPIARSAQKQQVLAIMCIETARLCVCINQVLPAQSTASVTTLTMSSTRMAASPDSVESQSTNIYRCEKEIDSWEAKLPDSVRYKAPEALDPSRGEDVIVLHQALLRMTCLAVSSYLHRPLVHESLHSTSLDPGLVNVSRRKVTEAADKMTDLIRHLRSHNLIQYLPANGIALLVPTICTHLGAVKVAVGELLATSLRQFDSCSLILREMQDTFVSAGVAHSVLEEVCQKILSQLLTARLANTNASVRQNSERPPSHPPQPRAPTSAAEEPKTAVQGFGASNVGATFRFLSPAIALGNTPPMSDGDSLRAVHAASVQHSNGRPSPLLEDSVSPGGPVMTNTNNNEGPNTGFPQLFGLRCNDLFSHSDREMEDMLVAALPDTLGLVGQDDLTWMTSICGMDAVGDVQIGQSTSNDVLRSPNLTPSSEL